MITMTREQRATLREALAIGLNGKLKALTFVRAVLPDGDVQWTKARTGKPLVYTPEDARRVIEAIAALRGHRPTERRLHALHLREAAKRMEEKEKGGKGGKRSKGKRRGRVLRDRPREVA